MNFPILGASGVDNHNRSACGSGSSSILLNTSAPGKVWKTRTGTSALIRTCLLCPLTGHQRSGEKPSGQHAAAVVELNRRLWGPNHHLTSAASLQRAKWEFHKAEPDQNCESSPALIRVRRTVTSPSRHQNRTLTKHKLCRLGSLDSVLTGNTWPHFAMFTHLVYSFDLRWF